MARFLRDEPDLRYNVLMDLTAVDYLTQDREPRYEMVAHLFSLPHNQRVRLKTAVPGDDSAGRLPDAGVGGGQLVRARGLRHVRHHF